MKNQNASYMWRENAEHLVIVMKKNQNTIAILEIFVVLKKLFPSQKIIGGFLEAIVS